MFDEPTKRQYKKRKKSRASSTLDTQQRVLDYVREREGKKIPAGRLARHLRVSEAYASMLLKMLAESKAITRHGKKGSYTYTSNRAKAKRRAYNKRGSVVVVSGPIHDLTPSAVWASRPAKRSYKPRRAAVLDYLKKHDGELVSTTTIAKAVGAKPGTVSHAVHSLEKEGVVRRGTFVARVGTRYTVLVGERPNLNPTHLPSQPVPYKKETYEEKIIREFLAWLKTREG